MLVAGGLVIGAAGAVLLTRFLQEQLFQVEATDPTSFWIGSLGLTLVAMLSCLIPAWRALRVDPVRAVHAE